MPWRSPKQLLQKYGSLGALAQASLDDLQTVKGIGRDKAVTLAAAFALARKMAEELRRDAPVLDTPEAVANLMREDTRLRNVETFQILLLNTRRRLIDVAKIADGTLDTILVHPREVFKPAIAANAAAIILLHNHPSGRGDPFGSGHQGDPRPDPSRPVAQDRGARPYYPRPGDPGTAQGLHVFAGIGLFCGLLSRRGRAPVKKGLKKAKKSETCRLRNPSNLVASSLEMGSTLATIGHYVCHVIGSAQAPSGCETAP